jgi:hypothetical protein
VLYIVLMIVSRGKRRYYIKLECDPCTPADTGEQVARVSRADEIMRSIGLGALKSGRRVPRHCWRQQCLTLPYAGISNALNTNTRKLIAPLALTFTSGWAASVNVPLCSTCLSEG